MQYKLYVIDPTYVRGSFNSSLAMYEAARAQFAGRHIAAGFRLDSEVGVPAAFMSMDWFNAITVFPALVIVSPTGNVIKKLQGEQYNQRRIYDVINSILPTATLPVWPAQSLPNRPIVNRAIQPVQQQSSWIWLLLAVAGTWIANK